MKKLYHPDLRKIFKNLNKINYNSVGKSNKFLNYWNVEFQFQKKENEYYLLIDGGVYDITMSYTHNNAVELINNYNSVDVKASIPTKCYENISVLNDELFKNKQIMVTLHG